MAYYFLTVLLLFFTSCFSSAPIETDHLFVLYDAGETTALLPVFQKLEKQGRNFRILVMATAETRLTPDLFPGKRLTLVDLGIAEKIDVHTPRTTGLKAKSLRHLSNRIRPKTLIVGTASQIQRQFIQALPQSDSFAYVDNFYYDPAHEAYKTVKKVQALANHVLCPGRSIARQLEQDAPNPKRDYRVVGKPSLEVWEDTIAQYSQLKKTQQVAITLIGGYGPGYELVDPLFEKLAQSLREKHYLVFYQLHPRILAQLQEKALHSTEEALALTKLTGGMVIGYNSSVPFEAALIGIQAGYFLPKAAPPFHHGAVQQGLLPAFESEEQLLQYLQNPPPLPNLREILQVPSRSTDLIIDTLRVK